jgi:selenocysteine lyase/cysteine desulfurase
MNQFRDAFDDFPDRVWLNCAHQGPVPRAAARAAREAVDWKLAPWELTAERFADVPQRLRQALGRLIGVPADDVILQNGASHGLHLWAQGLDLGEGDEVFLMAGDFPSNLLPWLPLRERGVCVHLVEPERFVLTPDEIDAALRRAGPATGRRVLSMSWVHSFSGHTADLARIGEICRHHGSLFLVNTTQGLGARRLRVMDLPVDAITNVGWKWLCGPYATGFSWMRPELRETLRPTRTYWLAQQTADDLGQDARGEPEIRDDTGARRHELFAPANFFNFHPWAASLELLLELGLDEIEAHDQALVQRLIDGLDRDRYELLSPESGPARSTLVFVSHREPGRNREVYDGLMKRGIYGAFRRGRIRLAPHLYNTEGDVDRVVEALDKLPA